jgi:hypothetical protein
MLDAPKIGNTAPKSEASAEAVNQVNATAIAASFFNV